MASPGRPRKEAEPDPPAPARKGKLPDAEVQSLADTALAAWESGLTQDVADSTGATWTFRVVRDPLAGLELIRAVPDALTRDAHVSQMTLGTETARHAVAAMILALAEPVV